MDPRRGFHRRFFNKRQGIGEVLGGLFSSTSSSVSQSTATPAASLSTESDPGLGGIIGGFTSLMGDVPTLILPSSTGSTTASASAKTTSSILSTVSTPASATTTNTAPTPTPTPTPTTSLTPSPSSSNTVYASSDGTRVVYITKTFSPSSATATHSTSFLQNPSLEGGVFALVGLVVLIILSLLITWVVRKRRRDRLERDTAVAVTFDPGTTDHYEQENSIEKHRLSLGSSSLDHGYGYGYGGQVAYAPQQEYHGPMGYGQYPVPAHSVPPPNLVPYQMPSPATPQPAAQGGANLTRKFSDRKPVPPLLPSPAYNSSDPLVSIPPQFNQQ